MNKLYLMVQTTFLEIIKKYNLLLVQMDENEVFLVGNEFALSVCFSREGINIYYLDSNIKDQGGHICIHPISRYITKRFTNEERELLTNTSPNDKKRIITELQFFSRGMLNHWKEILSGDKKWLELNKLKDKHAWKGIVINKDHPVYTVLAPIFADQNERD